MAKSPLGQLLINVKVNDAACRRDNLRLAAQVGTYNNLAESVTKLYEFLRGKSISEIERLTK